MIKCPREKLNRDSADTETLVETSRKQNIRGSLCNTIFLHASSITKTQKWNNVHTWWKSITEYTEFTKTI